MSFTVESEEGEASVVLPGGEVGIERAPGLEVLGQLWVTMDDLLTYAALPQVRFEKQVDLPLQGGGFVTGRMYSIDGMLLKGMGCILIMGDHSAMKADMMAQDGLQQSVDDYRLYKESLAPVMGMTAFDHGRELVNVQH